MRERLVIAFVGLTLAVIGLYGVPRAYFLADLVRDQQTERLDIAASALAGLINERRAHGGDVDTELLAFALGEAERVELTTSTGEHLVVGAPQDGTGGIEETRTLPDDTTIRLSVSADSVGAGIRAAIMPLVLLGIALAFGSALLGFAAARFLSRPFQELAGHSRELGHGRFDLDIPTYSMPEADAIGSSLRGAAVQLDELVRREREFAANASHQLRTPITALRLSLEDLTLWPDVDPAVADELGRGLGELDRLSAAIDELLDLARGRRLDAQQEVDLTAIATANASRWRRRLAEEGRDLVLEAPDAVWTRVPVGPVEQVLDVLVDNARLHGTGTITITVRDVGTHLELLVGDEGPRRIGPQVFQRGFSTGAGTSEGLGLAIASELAEVCGGHLSLDSGSAVTRFVLWLPRREAEGSATA